MGNSSAKSAGSFHFHMVLTMYANADERRNAGAFTRSPCRFRHSRLFRQGGFSLIEATAVLFVTAMLVGLFTRELDRSLASAQIDNTRAGMLILAEAVSAYRIGEFPSQTPPQPAAWPADFAALAAYAPAFANTTPPGGRNGVGKPYSFRVPTPATSNAPIVIETDMEDADFAELLERELLGLADRTGSVVSIEVPVPGHEPARDSLLRLDGTRDMTGDLGLATNDISNAEEVRVNTRVRVGTNTVSPNTVRFLNGAYGLGCSTGVTISGSAASCFAPTCATYRPLCPPSAATCSSLYPCPPCPPPPVCPPVTP